MKREDWKWRLRWREGVVFEGGLVELERGWRIRDYIMYRWVEF